MRAASAAPAVEIAVDGAGLPATALAALASVRVARRLSLPAQGEMAFCLEPSAGPAGTELAARLPIGSRVVVSVAGDHHRLFEGEVTAHEWAHAGDGAGELRVRAYDELHRWRKRQRVLARTQITAADLAEELGAESGMAVEATADGPRWPLLVQHRQSDLELLQEVTEQAGMWFAMVDGSLRLFTLEGLGDPIDLVLHDSLVAARFDATADPACRTVHARGWDPVAAGAISAEATRARAGRDVAIDVGPASVGTDGDRFLVDRPGPTIDHLAAVAQSELDRQVAREVTFAGTAEGDARLMPGRPVRVSGAHPEVSGTYVLTDTVHTVDGAGYFAELSSAPPASRPKAGGASTTLGRVTSADDPEGLGRVRVALPGYGDVETDWREVVTAGAGPRKGIVALPEVDDRVLVLLPHGDPAAAIVLGGLYGDSPPVDPGIEGGAVKRWSVWTPGGHRVVLDDHRGRIVVANGVGSAIVLDPDTVTVHAVADLVIEAPGRTMTLRANRIEMLQATEPEDGPVTAGEGA